MNGWYIEGFLYKKDLMNIGKGNSLGEIDFIIQYSMQDTLPYNFSLF